jgi:predicted acylesterase/phospholipase RssA
MFGAWQAGAWRALAPRLRPDLVVGASAGALNGYAIAGGATPDELRQLWLEPSMTRLGLLPDCARELVEKFPPKVDYAVVLTDLWRLKPRIFQGAVVTWKHLAASCSIPLVMPHYKIGGRLYTDGGLLNPLPVWAAVELGATHIIALHALPEMPSIALKPFVHAFRVVFGHHPPTPAAIELTIIQPKVKPLGSLRDALYWKQENIERWLAQGEEDALEAAGQNISVLNCFGR